LATTNSSVGAYDITSAAGSLAATNYSFNFTNGTLAVVQAELLVSASNQSRLYGGTNPALTYGISGFVGTDTLAVVSGSPGLSTAADTNSVVAAYPIVITNLSLAATNYAFSFTNGVLTVAPAPLGVTANATNRAYGAANPAFTASYSGFVNNDTTSVLSGSPSLTSAADTNSPVGTYDIAAAVGGLAATNYSFTFTNGTLTVVQAALGVTANSTNRLYGAGNPAFTASYSGFVNNETTGVLSGSPSLTSAADTNSPVGTYDITAAIGGLAATNYSFNFTNGTLTITPATLLVSADNQTRSYGATNPVLTYSLSGYQGTDTASSVSGTATVSTSADAACAVGSYPITVTNGTLSATNYTFTFANGTLRVVATPPVILSITGAGTTNVVITWAALSNATYRVRYFSGFASPGWQDLTPDITATNGTASVVDHPGDAPQRFYQVVVP
jgi:hypothetical protein